MRKTNLLINEPPLQVLPSLAIIIGLNEAIALQQLHYWLMNPKIGKEINGHKWVYNNYVEWQEDNFPFWSVRTVQRVFLSLEKIGVVVSIQPESYDRTKYYRIDYDKLAQWTKSDCVNPECQDDTMEDDNLAHSSLTETTTETTRNNSSNTASSVSSFMQNAGLSDARSILEQAAGILTTDFIPKIDIVYQLEQKYGKEATIKGLREAREAWIKTKRKDNSGYYLSTNPAWVDWAVAHLAGETPWNGNGHKKQETLEQKAERIRIAQELVA